MFGASWIKGKDVLFNRETRYVHFAESDCDPKSIEKVDPSDIKYKGKIKFF